MTTNYKYAITINQLSWNYLELEGVLDAIDLMMFSILWDFGNSKGVKKMFENGKLYFLFNWELIRKNKVLGLKSRSPILRRYKKLVNAKIIEPHPDNQKLNAAWYCFTENAEILFNVPKELIEAVSDKTHVSSIKDNTCPPSRTTRVLHQGHN